MFLIMQPTLINNIYQAFPQVKLMPEHSLYFGTLDYDFGEKYGLGAVVRRDGSYRFTKRNRWGTFWSVAGRWNIDKESFMEGAGFGMLKLRALIPKTQGNQNIVGAAGGNNALLLSPNIIYDLNSTYKWL